MIKTLYLIALALLLGLLQGCVMGIPDYYPPPKPAKVCKVFVRVDSGPWMCQDSEEWERTKKVLFPPEEE